MSKLIDDSVDLYMNGAKHCILTREEEVELAKRIEDGVEAEKILESDSSLSGRVISEYREKVKEGELARNKLIRHNLALVVSIVLKFLKKKHVCNKILASHLISDGNLALVNFVDRIGRHPRGFDWRRGIKFSTFFTPRCKHVVRDAFRKRTETAFLSGILSVENYFLDGLEDRKTLSPLDELIVKERKEAREEFMRLLKQVVNDRDFEIIRRHFEMGQSFREIGEYFSKSRERMRVCYNCALESLRQMIIAKAKYDSHWRGVLEALQE